MLRRRILEIVYLCYLAKGIGREWEMSSSISSHFHMFVSVITSLFLPASSSLVSVGPLRCKNSVVLLFDQQKSSFSSLPPVPQNKIVGMQQCLPSTDTLPMWSGNTFHRGKHIKKNHRTQGKRQKIKYGIWVALTVEKWFVLKLTEHHEALEFRTCSHSHNWIGERMIMHPLLKHNAQVGSNFL